jgi:hypothetical protein
MSAPTPVTKTFWDGERGMTRWLAAWTDGTQLTDTVAVDVSALSPAVTAVKVRSIDLILNGDLQIDLEFDATTDEQIDRFIGQSDVTVPMFRDYRDGPNEAYIPDQTATGFAGDILLTSANAASGDEVNLLIIFEKAV